MRQDSWPALLGVAAQVHDEIDLYFVEKTGRVAISLVADIVKLIELTDDAGADRAFLVAAEADAENLETRAVVQLEQLRQQISRRVGSEVAR